MILLSAPFSVRCLHSGADREGVIDTVCADREVVIGTVCADHEGVIGTVCVDREVVIFCTVFAMRMLFV